MGCGGSKGAETAPANNDNSNQPESAREPAAEQSSDANAAPAEDRGGDEQAAEGDN